MFKEFAEGHGREDGRRRQKRLSWVMELGLPLNRASIYIIIHIYLAVTGASSISDETVPEC